MVNRSVAILSLIWFAGICKQGDALYVNGYAASECSGGSTISRSGGASCGRRGASGWMLDAYGMVRDVFVEIREDQQQLEHAIALFRLGLVGALFQILHRRERIGKQPFQAVFRQQGAFTATRESQIGAQECFIEKMIQAELRTSQRRRHKLSAPWTGAMDGNSGFHPTPLILERLRPRGWGESSTKFLRASCCEL
jgi:hypothetical protein